MEAVEYVVRQDGLKSWSVWMVELDISGTTPRFINSTSISHHRTLQAADRAATNLRACDEAHIDKVRKAA